MNKRERKIAEELQDEVGRINALMEDDRNPRRMDNLKPHLNRAQELCYELRRDVDPMEFMEDDK